jgi:hypothetical protein
MSDDNIELIPDPAPETIQFSELLLLSLEQRFGRLCASLETTAKAATAGANNIEGLTAQVHRLADAFEQMAGFIGCVTESVESEADGGTRCFIRTRDDNHGWFLSQRDERE